jgi:cytochrome P450
MTALTDLVATARASIDATTAAGGVVLFVILYYIIWPVRMDSREPPMLRPKVPFFGHLLGLIQHSNQYGDMIFKPKRAPGHTLPIMGGKMYVLNTPGLVEAVFKNRSLSFDPHVQMFIEKTTSVDRAGLDIWENPEFYHQWLKILYGSLTGQTLLDMNVRAVDNIAKSLNAFKRDEPEIVDNFFDWTRKLILAAASDAIWGNKSPLRDAENVQHYWDYEAGLHLLMAGSLPSLFNSTPYKARTALQKAFADYYESRGDDHEDVPIFTRERYALERKFGMDKRNSGAIEVAVAQGAIFNTIMIAYWLFSYVVNDPALVERMRAELTTQIEEDKSQGEDGERVMKLHMNRIEQNCPLVTSAFRETQRFKFLGTTNRKVMADTEVTDGKTTYLLKAGQQLMIPNWPLQKDQDAWDGDGHIFRADRFLKKDAADGKGFFPWGGGKHICPGRYFASGEIMGAVAILLLAFDVTDLEDKPLKIQESVLPPLTNGIGRPADGSDLRAKITRRKGWENVRWTVVA